MREAVKLGLREAVGLGVRLMLFALVAGLLSVLPGGETAAGGHVRRGGRCAR